MARTIGSDGKTTRARIERRALELIARLGFEALTMRQLAGACGLQAGALYHYFADKQALLMALAERHQTSLLQGVELSVSTGSPEARLRQFASYHIRHNVQNRHASHVANNELRSLSRANFAVILKLRGAYEKHLRQILKDGADSGEFDIADLTLMTMGIIALLNEVSVWHRDGGALTLDDVCARFGETAAKMAVKT